METALRYELVRSIPELKDQTFPTNAPEDAEKPYLVYARVRTNKEKNLDGYTGEETLSYMFSVMAKKYGDMAEIRKQVEELLISMVKREIGNIDKYYIEDLTINNIEEQYEHQLKVNRGIIDFTIYFKGVKENG